MTRTQRADQKADSETAPVDSTSPIPVFDLNIEPSDIEAVEAVLASGRLAMGEKVAEFEQIFAESLGARHVVATSSCTTALHLSLLTAGVGPGDEVIVPAYTFVATVATIIQAGATPVFADIVGPQDLCIDPAEVERLIGPKTKAVMIVHYGGYPAAPERISQICEERGVTLLEDSAHAPCATVAGRSLGTFGLSGSFSFFPNKILGIGEAGALCTDDDEVAQRARSMRSPQIDATPSFNYRLDEPRAAMLVSRVPRIRAEVERRRQLTTYYRELLREVDDIIVPFGDDQVATCSAYTMAIILPESHAGPRRDDLRRALQDRGVQTTMMYPGIHEFTIYRKRYPDVSLPRTENAARRQVTLPLFGEMQEAQVERVVETLSAAIAEAA